MPQYNSYVAVTNGVNTVVVPGVDATTDIPIGSWFTIRGSGVSYQVSGSSYLSPDTTVSLSANYAGLTSPSENAVFFSDFSASLGIPLLNDGDVEAAAIFSRAMQTIEDAILTAGWLSGDVDMAGSQLKGPSLAGYSEDVNEHPGATGAVALDTSLANVHSLAMTGDVTLTLSNPPASGKKREIDVVLSQDAVGGRTVTWPASVAWPGAAVPAMSTTANTISLFSLMTVDGGVTWIGSQVGTGIA